MQPECDVLTTSIASVGCNHEARIAVPRRQFFHNQHVCQVARSVARHAMVGKQMSRSRFCRIAS